VQSLFEQPNRFALASIMSCAGQREIVAESDIICRESGIKLLARGQVIKQQHHDRLLPRRLVQPFETSFVVRGGVEPLTLAHIMRDKIVQLPNLERVVQGHENAIYELLMDVKLKPPVRLLLTAALDRQDGTLDHAVMVAVLVAALARRAKLPHASQALLVQAGLTHDLGEMYINPAYLHSSQELSPAEWMQVVSHPKIGAQLLIELTRCSPALSDLVLHHHERFNGMGYPMRLQGEAFGREAQLLAMAEMASPIITKDENGLARVAFAMKLIANEFDPQLVGLVSTLAPSFAVENVEDVSMRVASTHLHELSAQLRQAYLAARDLTRQDLPPRAMKLAERYFTVLKALQQSLTATGALEFCNTVSVYDGITPDAMLSLQIIPRELRWRMRQVVRDIGYSKIELAPHEQAYFAPIEIALTQN
jgi:hypothetical protein